jgi:uncharacterized protein
MARFAYAANDIDTAGLPVESELPVPWLDAELADVGARARAPGHLSARLSRTGEEIVVRGRVKAALVMPCARCLDPAQLDVDGELSLLLHPVPHLPPPAKQVAGAKPNGSARTGKKGAPEPEYELHSAEADVDLFDGEKVILDGFIREALLLELPNFPLCSETCPGIRPHPAAPGDAEAPIDPRLAPLRALKSKLEASEGSSRGPGPEGSGDSPPGRKKKKE